MPRQKQPRRPAAKKKGKKKPTANIFNGQGSRPAPSASNQQNLPYGNMQSTHDRSVTSDDTGRYFKQDYTTESNFRDEAEVSKFWEDAGDSTVSQNRSMPQQLMWDFRGGSIPTLAKSTSHPKFEQQADEGSAVVLNSSNSAIRLHVHDILYDDSAELEADVSSYTFAKRVEKLGITAYSFCFEMLLEERPNFPVSFFSPGGGATFQITPSGRIILVDTTGKALETVVVDNNEIPVPIQEWFSLVIIVQGDRVGVAINSQPTLTFSVTKLSVKEKRKTRARTSSNSGSKDTDGAAHPQRGQHPFAQAPMEQEQQQQQQRAFHSDDDDDDAANSDDGGMFMPFMSDTDTESDGDDKFTANAPRSRQAYGGYGRRKPLEASLNPVALLLPASLEFNEETSSKVLVRYVRFFNQAIPESQLKQISGGIFSKYELEEQQKEERIFGSLVLSFMYKYPPPIWKHSSFLAQFADVYLPTSFSSVGRTTGSLLVLQRVFREMQDLEEIPTYFNADQRTSLGEIGSALAKMTTLWRKYPEQLHRYSMYMKKLFKPELEALAPGQFCGLPFGTYNNGEIMIIERTSLEFARVSIVQTSNVTYAPSCVGDFPRIKYRTLHVAPAVPFKKLTNDGFWVVHYCARNYGRSLDVFLQYLAGEPVNTLLDKTKDDACIQYHHVPVSYASHHYAPLLVMIKYLLLRLNFKKEQVQLVSFFLRKAYLRFVLSDLTHVENIEVSDRSILTIATRQYVHAALKLSKNDVLNTLDLERVRQFVTRIDSLASKLPLKYAETEGPPPPAILENTPTTRVHKFEKLPLFGRLCRLEDTDGYAGQAVPPVSYVPIDFTQIPRKVLTYDDALAAIRYCDKLTLLILNQSQFVKNRQHLIISMIAHTFGHVLPMPKSPTAPDADACFWRGLKMRFERQLDLMLMLLRIMENFLLALWTTAQNEQINELYVSIPVCITAIADAVMKKRATDIPSEVCCHLMGETVAGKRISKGYGLGLHKLVKQSQTILNLHPELAVNRTHAIDYFQGQDKRPPIFRWEDPLKPYSCDKYTRRFLTSLCKEISLPGPFEQHLNDSSSVLLHHYPELYAYRNIVFLMKYAQMKDISVSFIALQTRVVFQWSGDVYQVLMAGQQVQQLHKAPDNRRELYAVASRYITSERAKTEDDILHARAVPTFSDVLPLEDSELLMSYLTAPYLRVPLVMSLFCTDDRIQMLQAVELQQILYEVLFLPETFSQQGKRIAPEVVPTDQRPLLATPYGMLINELTHSPETIMKCSLSLLRQALSLDTGDPKQSTTNIILFVTRISCYVDSYTSMLIDIAEGRHESFSHHTQLRHSDISAETLATLKDGLAAIRVELRRGAYNIINHWIERTTKHVLEMSNIYALDTETIELAKYYAHLLLIFRNVKVENITEDVMSLLSSGFLFMTDRYQWTDSLGIRDFELFECLQLVRQRMIDWTRRTSVQSLSSAFEAAIRVASGSGQRRLKRRDDDHKLRPCWAYIAGSTSCGRYTTCKDRHYTVASHKKALAIKAATPASAAEEKASLTSQQDEGDLDDQEELTDTHIDTLPDDKNIDIELDLQVMQLTVNKSHLMGLDSEIAGSMEVAEVFGQAGNFQCTVVEDAQNRKWVRLVGRNHDVQYWRTQDQRPWFVDADREYIPSMLAEHERWIVPLFEPIRFGFFFNPFQPIPIMIQDEPLTEDANLCQLVVLHPQTYLPTHEVWIIRGLQCVHVYRLISHGRRYYRSMVYSSDARFSNKFDQPSTGSRQSPWPEWGRHACGYPHTFPGRSQSSVVTRGWDYSDNVSGGTEMHLPSWILKGVVPDILIEKYVFWQDENDVIRGYPKTQAQLNYNSGYYQSQPTRNANADPTLEDKDEDGKRPEDMNNHIIYIKANLVEGIGLTNTFEGEAVVRRFALTQVKEEYNAVLKVFLAIERARLISEAAPERVHDRIKTDQELNRIKKKTNFEVIGKQKRKAIVKRDGAGAKDQGSSTGPAMPTDPFGGKGKGKSKDKRKKKKKTNSMSGLDLFGLEATDAAPVRGDEDSDDDEDIDDDSEDEDEEAIELEKHSLGAAPYRFQYELEQTILEVNKEDVEVYSEDEEDSYLHSHLKHKLYRAQEKRRKARRARKSSTNAEMDEEADEIGDDVGAGSKKDGSTDGGASADELDTASMRDENGKLLPEHRDDFEWNEEHEAKRARACGLPSPFYFMQAVRAIMENLPYSTAQIVKAVSSLVQKTRQEAKARAANGEKVKEVRFKTFAELEAALRKELEEVHKFAKTTAETATLQLPTDCEKCISSIYVSPDVPEDERPLQLLNLVYAPKGTRYHSLAQVFTRLDSLSRVLVWTRVENVAKRVDQNPIDDCTFDLIEIPHLKLTFKEKKDTAGVSRIYSLDYSDLYITNMRDSRTTKLLQGLPHSLLLSNTNDEVQILVPAWQAHRPVIYTSPFSTELVINRTAIGNQWLKNLETPYYLYPVHVSLSFLFTPTLASALYLMVLRFMHRDYVDVFRMIDSIATDTHYSTEEQQIFNCLSTVQTDRDPDALSCFLAIAGVTTGTTQLGVDFTTLMHQYVMRLDLVTSQCRIDPEDEIKLFRSLIVWSESHKNYNASSHPETLLCYTHNRRQQLLSILDRLDGKGGKAGRKDNNNNSNINESSDDDGGDGDNDDDGGFKRPKDASASASDTTKPAATAAKTATEEGKPKREKGKGKEKEKKKHEDLPGKMNLRLPKRTHGASWTYFEDDGVFDLVARKPHRLIVGADQGGYGGLLNQGMGYGQQKNNIFQQPGTSSVICFAVFDYYDENREVADELTKIADEFHNITFYAIPDMTVAQFRQRIGQVLNPNKPGSYTDKEKSGWFIYVDKKAKFRGNIDDFAKLRKTLKDINPSIRPYNDIRIHYAEKVRAVASQLRLPESAVMQMMTEASEAIEVEVDIPETLEVLNGLDSLDSNMSGRVEEKKKKLKKKMAAAKGDGSFGDDDGVNDDDDDDDDEEDTKPKKEKLPKAWGAYRRVTLKGTSISEVGLELSAEHLGLIICEIKEGSAAAQHPSVFVHDVIAEVNGEFVVGSPDEAKKKLMYSLNSGTVDLTLMEEKIICPAFHEMPLQRHQIASIKCTACQEPFSNFTTRFEFSNLKEPTEDMMEGLNKKEKKKLKKKIARAAKASGAARKAAGKPASDEDRVNEACHLKHKELSAVAYTCTTCDFHVCTTCANKNLVKSGAITNPRACAEKVTLELFEKENADLPYVNPLENKRKHFFYDPKGKRMTFNSLLAPSHEKTQEELHYDYYKWEEKRNQRLADSAEPEDADANGKGSSSVRFSDSRNSFHALNTQGMRVPNSSGISSSRKKSKWGSRSLLSLPNNIEERGHWEHLFCNSQDSIRMTATQEVTNIVSQALSNTIDGLNNNLGFALIYKLLTGQQHVKILSGGARYGYGSRITNKSQADDAYAMGVILLQFVRDRFVKNPFSSVLMHFSRNQELASKAPELTTSSFYSRGAKGGASSYFGGGYGYGGYGSSGKQLTGSSRTSDKSQSGHSVVSIDEVVQKCIRLVRASKTVAEGGSVPTEEVTALIGRRRGPSGFSTFRSHTMRRGSHGGTGVSMMGMGMGMGMGMDMGMGMGRGMGMSDSDSDDLGDGLSIMVGEKSARKAKLEREKSMQMALSDDEPEYEDDNIYGAHGSGPSSSAAIPPLFAPLPKPWPKIPGPQLVFEPYEAEDEREWLLPVLSNFNCNRRILRAANLTGLAVTAEDLKLFSERPLASLNLDDIVQLVSRADAGKDAISDKLPFDVSAHDQARSKPAKAIMARLTDDIKLYANITNNETTPLLKAIQERQSKLLIEGQDSDDRVSLANGIVRQCHELLDKLRELRKEDSDFINVAADQLPTYANAVQIASESDLKKEMTPAVAADVSGRLEFVLERYTGKESFIWLEYLFGALLSDCIEEDLTKINPYVDRRILDTVIDLVVATLLRSNRIGHLNRAITAVEGVIAQVESVEKKLSSTDIVTEGIKSELLAGLMQKSQNAARMLLCKRTYMAREEQEGANTISYDPRYLVFEFTWNIMLRQAQVDLVRDIMSSMARGGSIVKQMIMGAGKTTVIGPLVCLMLADGKTLVGQVVPPSLLEFSRSVLRKTFSTIIRKRVTTLFFERSTAITEDLCDKLEEAKRKRSVVISTPTCIKSIMLKYFEGLDILADEAKPAKLKLKMYENAALLRRVLNVFSTATLIMDEVDLILHPLKSELNFPIGQKFDLDLAPERWELPTHMLDGIFYATLDRTTVGFEESSYGKTAVDQLRGIIDEGFETCALQRNPHIVLLDDAWYHDNLKPAMAEWCILWLEKHHVGGTGITRDDLLRFLLEPWANRDKALHEKLAAKLEIPQMKMLNLAHDWLRAYLPHCLAKIDRVSFGIMNAADRIQALEVDPAMPQSRLKLAIPFIGKDVPSRSSEFAHPDVIIGLSILAYRYEGLRWTDFTEIVASLTRTVRREVGPKHKRKTSVMYSKWIELAGGRMQGKIVYNEHGEVVMDEDDDYDEEKEVMPLWMLDSSNNDQMRKVYNLVRLLPEAIHWYLHGIVFPAYMRHQRFKLSASGQSVGGSMIFPRRIGFSGTPSDLLPIELGKCEYEKGTDGKMITVMTDPDVVSFDMLSDSWTVESLLDEIIRKSADEGFHALIDTGALITGLTNKQVARYLLNNGMDWCEGVVFLDENDRKVILVRATGRVVNLEQCGIPLSKRFAFYDQVHTTGMDIQHTLNATAVLTLGKDMTFRDFAQGAFRMRGIAKGQKIRLFVIPEVRELMRRELTRAEVPVASADNIVLMLQNVSAWLVINSMKAERIQYNQLCAQNVCNVFRKNAYKALTTSGHLFSPRKPVNDPRLIGALGIFKEPVDYDIEHGAPVMLDFGTVLRGMLKDNEMFLESDEDTKVAMSVINDVEAQWRDMVSASNSEDDPAKLDTTATREQEQEQEKEAEDEREREVHREIDLAYSRDDEEQDPWKFETLKRKLYDVPQFYPASEFALYKMRPLKFPEYSLMSHNYFDPRWSGDRRVKNVIMTLEWLPDRSDVSVMDTSYSGTEEQEALLKRAFSFFATLGDGTLDRMSLALAVRTYALREVLPETVDAVLEKFGDSKGEIDFAGFKNFVQSGMLTREEKGRYFVALSLAEAETVRRIMHVRLGKPIIAGEKTAIALRCSQASNAIFDKSRDYSEASVYNTNVAWQSLRFINSDMYYNQPQINCLLHALQTAKPRERRRFFEKIIGVRRRMKKKWKGTPIAALFSIVDQWYALKQRALAACMREAIASRNLKMYDACVFFDANKDGFVSASELKGAFTWLGIPDISLHDVLELVRTYDVDRDGRLSYIEFLTMVQRSFAAVLDEEENDDDDIDGEEFVFSRQASLSVQKSALLRQQSVGGTEYEHVLPENEEELEKLQKEWLNNEAREEKEYLRETAEEDRRIYLEIEEINDQRLIKDGIVPNPHVDLEKGEARYDFSITRVPRGLKWYGDWSLKEDSRTFCHSIAPMQPSSFYYGPLAEGVTEFEVFYEGAKAAPPALKEPGTKATAVVGGSDVPVPAPPPLPKSNLILLSQGNPGADRKALLGDIVKAAKARNELVADEGDSASTKRRVNVKHYVLPDIDVDGVPFKPDIEPFLPQQVVSMSTDATFVVPLRSNHTLTQYTMHMLVRLSKLPKKGGQTQLLFSVPQGQGPSGELFVDNHGVIGLSDIVQEDEEDGNNGNGDSKAMNKKKKQAPVDPYRNEDNEFDDEKSANAADEAEGKGEGEGQGQGKDDEGGNAQTSTSDTAANGEEGTEADATEPAAPPAAAPEPPKQRIDKRRWHVVSIVVDLAFTEGEISVVDDGADSTPSSLAGHITTYVDGQFNSKLAASDIVSSLFPGSEPPSCNPFAIEHQFYLLGNEISDISPAETRLLKYLWLQYRAVEQHDIEKCMDDLFNMFVDGKEYNKEVLVPNCPNTDNAFHVCTKYCRDLYSHGSLPWHETITKSERKAFCKQVAHQIVKRVHSNRSYGYPPSEDNMIARLLPVIVSHEETVFREKLTSMERYRIRVRSVVSKVQDIFGLYRPVSPVASDNEAGNFSDDDDVDDYQFGNEGTSFGRKTVKSGSGSSSSSKKVEMVIKSMEQALGCQLCDDIEGFILEYAKRSSSANILDLVAYAEKTYGNDYGVEVSETYEYMQEDGYIVHAKNGCYTFSADYRRELDADQEIDGFDLFD